MTDEINFYKKDGDNIPVAHGVSSPFLPASLYDKIQSQLSEGHDLYVFINGTSFKAQRLSDDLGSDIGHQAE